VTARAKGRRLAKATATTTSVGATAVLLRFGAAAKKLARKRPVTVALTVDYTGYGGPSRGGATLTLSR
jgi:hypothetical protein